MKSQLQILKNRIFEKKTTMKNTMIRLCLLAFAVMLSGYLKSQCTPGDETTCPDPENNGEVCPDSMPDATINQMYSQDFTILAPAEYILDSTAGVVIDLHHIKIKDVGNLPPGITWVSNAEDSVFMVGTYYCVLLEGTPTLKGHFTLEIVIDVYIPGILGSPPIFVGTVTDSTSLAMNVTDPSNIGEFDANLFNLIHVAPNPFSESTKLVFESAEPDTYTFEVFEIRGRQVFSRNLQASPGINTLTFNGNDLKPGVYIYHIRNKQGFHSGRLMKYQ
jgi:hypothetical protein